MRCFGYCRVSTAMQANDGNSLDEQVRRIKGYAMMQGWEIDEADILIERGVSGKLAFEDRPEGSKLLASVEPGDVIIATKMNRAFRNARVALETLDMLKAKRVGLIFMDLGGDVTGNGISKMVYTILAAVDENFRENLSERVRESKQYRAAVGLYNGGKKQFGYDIVDGKLVENADEQAILRQMMERRAAGISYHKIGAEFGKDAKSVKRMLDRIA